MNQLNLKLFQHGDNSRPYNYVKFSNSKKFTLDVTDVSSQNRTGLYKPTIHTKSEAGHLTLIWVGVFDVKIGSIAAILKKF